MRCFLYKHLDSKTTRVEKNGLGTEGLPFLVWAWDGDKTITKRNDSHRTTIVVSERNVNFYLMRTVRCCFLHIHVYVCTYVHIDVASYWSHWCKYLYLVYSIHVITSSCQHTDVVTTHVIFFFPIYSSAQAREVKSGELVALKIIKIEPGDLINYTRTHTCIQVWRRGHNILQ